MSKDFEFFNIGDYDISNDNNIMAYSYDTLSRRIYQIRIKNLIIVMFPETLENTTGSIVFATTMKLFSMGKKILLL